MMVSWMRRHAVWGGGMMATRRRQVWHFQCVVVSEDVSVAVNSASSRVGKRAAMKLLA